MKLINQLIISMEYMFNILNKNGFISNPINSSKLLSQVKIKDLLNILIESALSSIEYIEMNNKTKRRLNINRNEINQISIFETLYTELIFKISLLLLPKNKIVLSKRLSYIYDHVEYIKKDNNNHSLDKVAYQLIDIFIDVFECTNRVVHYSDERKTHKSMKLISLPNSLVESFISSNHIPEITPVITNFESIQSLIKSSKKIEGGMSCVELSEQTKKCLKTSQRKKLTVSNDAISLFNRIDNFDYEIVKNVDSLPFVPIAQITELIKTLKSMEEMNIFLSNNAMKEVLKKRCEITTSMSKELENPAQKIKLLEEPQLSEEQHLFLNKYVDISKELDNKIMHRKMHNTVIEFANIY